MLYDSRTKEAQDRLKHWGSEFRIRELDPRLGHRSKDMLQILIEHKGEMPPPVTGYKPEEVDVAAMEIEDLVRVIFEECPRAALILRAYYCGSGRKGVERLELARYLIFRVTGSPIAMDRMSFFQAVAAGEARVVQLLATAARRRRARAA